jgi:hypothetical protein
MNYRGEARISDVAQRALLTLKLRLVLECLSEGTGSSTCVDVGSEVYHTSFHTRAQQNASASMSDCVFTSPKAWITQRNRKICRHSIDICPCFRMRHRRLEIVRFAFFKSQEIRGVTYLPTFTCIVLKESIRVVARNVCEIITCNAQLLDIHRPLPHAVSPPSQRNLRTGGKQKP